MMRFPQVSTAAFALVAIYAATSSWCQVPNRPVPAVQQTNSTLVPSGNDAAGQTVPPRPASLAYVPDQKPKRAEPLLLLDHPERLNAAVVALAQAPKTDFVKSSDPVPLLARPALPVWAPDDFGDVPMILDSNRPTMKAEAK